VVPERGQPKIAVPRSVSLLMYAQEAGRICPMPAEWDLLWKMIPGAKAPLILAAWWHSTATEKRRRLEDQVIFAAMHGLLEVIEPYLRNLTPEQWHVQSAEVEAGAAKNES